MNIHETIKEYRELGLSLIPVPFKSKAAIVEWKEYQDRQPTEEEINSWFNGHDSNIAIICGKVSGNLVILDCDSMDKFYELGAVICQKTGLTDILEFTKASQTGKGVHLWLRTKEPTKSCKFPALDIKAEGGYIIAPPSIHPSGAEYKFINDIPITVIDSLKDIGIDVNQTTTGESGKQPGWVSQMLEGVGQGARNDSAAKLAGYFRNLTPVDVTERILLDWNKKNSPPMPEYELRQVIASIYRKPERPNTNTGDSIKSIYHNSPDISAVDTERHKSVTENVTKTCDKSQNVTEPLSKRIEEWIKDTSGWFSYDDIDKELNLRSEDEKHNRRMIIKRLKDSVTIESHPKNNKLLRYVNVNVRLIDFKSATNRQPLAIKYPFGIEKYFNTYPGNIIVVAGTPDAGKTAFLLNFVHMNQFNFPIFYQSSEMGEVELASRLSNFTGITLDEWNFTPEERSSNFKDVIRPDCINIIDFMEITGDFYEVAQYLKEIHDRLAGGIAIVALQKDPKSDQGRGGTFGLEKPRLYLNMDPGKMTIRKAKNWTNPTYNPNGLEINYKIIGGCKFQITQGWHEKDKAI